MLTPRNPFQTRNLISFITIYYLYTPILLIYLSLINFYLLSIMCPFMSSCSNRSHWIVSHDDLALAPLSPLYAPELGCSSSRSWAEINTRFGEPIGSVRRVQKLGLGAEREVLTCNLGSDDRTGGDFTEDVKEETEILREVSPGDVLDMSLKKQKRGIKDDLYRKVLVENTVKIVQVEINRKIMESFMFF